PLKGIRVAAQKGEFDVCYDSCIRRRRHWGCGPPWRQSSRAPAIWDVFPMGDHYREYTRIVLDRPPGCVLCLQGRCDLVSTYEVVFDDRSSRRFHHLLE